MTPCIENVSRRTLLSGLAATGGLMLAARLPVLAQEPEKFGADAMPHGTVSDPRVFVSIAPDGTVTIVAHRAEMGQGVRTGIPLIVAEEMEADWSRVKVAQADADEERYGNQNTDGSRSTRHFLRPMRECGAAARMMLEAAAASRWGVDPAQVRAQNHEVVHAASGRRLGYGALAAEAARLPVPAAESIVLKDPRRFRYIGREGQPLIDGPDIATGRAIYSLDARLDGMKYAVIARPPVLGGQARSVDSAAAMQVAGVEKIVPIEGTPPPGKFMPLGGVAVIARNTWAAINGRDALKITWDDGPNASYDSAEYRRQLQQAASRPGKVVRNEGDTDAALASAARLLQAEYYIPHLAHAPMEPPSALARFRDGKCEVWCGVQNPQATVDEIAVRLGLDPKNVVVHCTLLGGGFGRKSKPDYAIEAALLAKDLGDVPVQVVWTREDDIRHGYYHTVSVERLEAALDAGGRPLAWKHRSVAPPIASIFKADEKYEGPAELGMGLVDVPFACPNVRVENGEAEAKTRIGWFRSVSNIPHVFAVQSFVAELAAAARRDQKDYLLEMIGPARIVDPRKSADGFWNYGEAFDRYPIDTARLRRVVEIAAERSGWGRTLPARHGLGIAAHRSFVTYVATVVEAAVDDKGALTVPRVDVVIDCGALVNPDRVRAQMEGACVMGMSLATKNEITFSRGRVQQGNFDDYDVTRIGEAPREIRVHLVEAGFDVPPGGVGEPGLPPFAPALANAIFAAVGKRIRRLPIGDQLAT